jgi:putative hemolysin
MPASFDNCRANGGKIRTKSLSGGKYIHICFDKNGKSHAGEVKTSLKRKK